VLPYLSHAAIVKQEVEKKCAKLTVFHKSIIVFTLPLILMSNVLFIIEERQLHHQLVFISPETLPG
jgi:hypothetical protein